MLASVEGLNSRVSVSGIHSYYFNQSSQHLQVALTGSESSQSGSDQDEIYAGIGLAEGDFKISPTQINRSPMPSLMLATLMLKLPLQKTQTRHVLPTLLKQQVWGLRDARELVNSDLGCLTWGRSGTTSLVTSSGLIVLAWRMALFAHGAGLRLKQRPGLGVRAGHWASLCIGCKQPSNSHQKKHIWVCVFLPCQFFSLRGRWGLGEPYPRIIPRAIPPSHTPSHTP